MKEFLNIITYNKTFGKPQPIVNIQLKVKHLMLNGKKGTKFTTFIYFRLNKKKP